MKQKSLDTTDYGAGIVNASSLNDEGISLTYSGITSGKGTFGVFYDANGTLAMESFEYTKDFKTGEKAILAKGDELKVRFSSEKLMRLFTRNQGILIGKIINISGRGEGVEREYTVKADL